MFIYLTILMTPRAEVHVWAQASYGTITVLKHLKAVLHRNACYTVKFISISTTRIIWNRLVKQVSMHSWLDYSRIIFFPMSKHQMCYNQNLINPTQIQNQ